MRRSWDVTALLGAVLLGAVGCGEVLDTIEAVDAIETAPLTQLDPEAPKRSLLLRPDDDAWCVTAVGSARECTHGRWVPDAGEGVVDLGATRDPSGSCAGAVSTDVAVRAELWFPEVRERVILDPVTGPDAPIRVFGACWTGSRDFLFVGIDEHGEPVGDDERPST